MKKWFLILLALALPVTGATAQENEVVALPTVAPLVQVEVSSAADYSTASLAEYYTPSETESAVDEQMPHMTAEEGERARTLLKAYQAGTRPAENVLNKLEYVVVGVYTLNLEDYEGETLYTLLPVTPLTDEQILEVIDAFAQSGQTFDPDALSYKNCMRGGSIEASRFFQEDERNRQSILRDLYIHQGLTSKAVYTPLVSDDGQGMATLDPDSYCGLERFLFLPCRQLTDDELLGYVIYTESGDPTEYGNYEAYEKQLRAELARVAGAPLVMTREYEGMGRMGDFNTRYDDEKVYYAYFLAPDGTQYGGYLDVAANKLISANIYRPNTFQYSDLHLNPFDEQWLAVAKDAVLRLRGDGMGIQTLESHGETDVQYAGYGVIIDVIMEDGSDYEMAIPYQTGTASNWITYDTKALDTDQLYAALYQ
jgi:hypothetical protein